MPVSKETKSKIIDMIKKEMANEIQKAEEDNKRAGVISDEQGLGFYLKVPYIKNPYIKIPYIKNPYIKIG